MAASVEDMIEKYKIIQHANPTGRSKTTKLKELLLVIVNDVIDFCLHSQNSQKLPKNTVTIWFFFFSSTETYFLNPFASDLVRFSLSVSWLCSVVVMPPVQSIINHELHFELLSTMVMSIFASLTMWPVYLLGMTHVYETASYPLFNVS